MDAISFWILAALLVVSAVLVVGQRNPMYSVFLLIVSFVALSGLYILLDAPFVAVIQIIVYVGAIMVLFLFVVMLLERADGGLGAPGTSCSGCSAARARGGSARCSRPCSPSSWRSRSRA